LFDGKMNTNVNLADLDAEIDSVERTLTMCREGGLTGLTAAVEREIARNMLPGIAALAARYWRLETALGADRTRRKVPAKRPPRG
jgi:hypothetical protein